MTRRPLPGGGSPTFRVSVCKAYDAALPKDANHSRVSANWEIEEITWEEQAVTDLVTKHGISPNFYREGKRSNQTWAGAGSVMLDFDDGEITEADLATLQTTWQFDSFLFSSQNHRKEKGGKKACDRLRAFIPLSRSVNDPSELQTLKQFFLELVPGIDPSCFDPARYFAHGTTSFASFDFGKGFLDIDGVLSATTPPAHGKGPTRSTPYLDGLKRAELDRQIGIPSVDSVSMPNEGEYPERVRKHISNHPGGALAQTLSGTRSQTSMYKSSPDGTQMHDRSMHDIAIAGLCFRIDCSASEVIQTMLACPFGKSRSEWLSGGFQGYEYVLHKVRDAYQRYESEKAADLGDSPPAMAERFLRNQYPKQSDWPTLLRWQDRLYAYNGRHWAPLEEAELDHQINAFLATTEARQKAGTHFEVSVKRNVIARSHLSNKVEIGQWLDGRDEGLQINLKSCLLSVNDWLASKTPTHSHTPVLFTTSCLPFPYDDKATCPRWNRFLDEVLPSKDLQRMIQQMMGLFLIPDASYQRFWVLLGRAGTGKSTVSHVLSKLLGDDNVSNASLDQLSDRFIPITLLGKLANLSSEIETQDLKSGEKLIKNIVGQDEIALEEKYKPVIHTKITARLLFTCNQLPLFKDYGGSIGRRLIIIPMDTVIPEAQRDQGLWDELETELPGVFNWALEGLRDLREHGLFQAAVSKKAVREHLAEGKPWEGWIQEYLEFDSTYSSDLGCTEVYQYFEAHFQALGYRRLMTEATFGRALKEVYPLVTRTRPQVNGQREYRYSGLMWRSNVPPPDPTPMGI